MKVRRRERQERAYSPHTLSGERDLHSAHVHGGDLYIFVKDQQICRSPRLDAAEAVVDLQETGRVEGSHADRLP